jgi:hypothetical protein
MSTHDIFMERGSTHLWHVSARRANLARRLEDGQPSLLSHRQIALLTWLTLTALPSPRKDKQVDIPKVLRWVEPRFYRWCLRVCETMYTYKEEVLTPRLPIMTWHTGERVIQALHAIRNY